jgi:hypothetical protein
MNRDVVPVLAVLMVAVIIMIMHGRRDHDHNMPFVEGLREESPGHVLRRAHPLTTLPSVKL